MNRRGTREPPKWLQPASVCGAVLASLFVLAGRPAGAAAEPEVAFSLAAESGGAIESARFSADGKSVLTTGTKPTIGIWDAKTGKAVRAVEPPDDGSVVDLSADGGMAVGFVKDAVVVWDLAAGKQLVALKAQTANVLPVRFSADGTQVVTGSKDKTAKVWEVKTGKLVTTFTGHKGPIASAAFNADGTRVATGSYFGEVKVWDAKSGKEQLDLKGMSTSNNPTVFSADDKLVVSPRFESPAVWSTKDGKEVQEFSGHKGWCRTAAFSPSADRIVTAGLDKTARVWDVKTGKVVHTLTHGDEVRSAVFSPDGTRVVTVSEGKARVWVLPTEK